MENLEMKILEWSSIGLRCPDHRISFEKEDNEHYPITFVQMPNGTGKTTTLELLRGTLSGKYANEIFDKKSIAKFKKNHHDVSEGQFTVKVLINKKIYTFTVNFDFSSNTVDFKTTVYAQGVEDGFNPPRECRNFMQPQFINYFIFDGELAPHLIDPKKEGNHAETLINLLFKLWIFDEILKTIEEYYNLKIKGKNTSKTTLDKYIKMKLIYTEKVEIFTKELEKIKKKIKEKDEQLHENENLYEKLNDSKKQEKINSITSEITELEKNKSATLNELKTISKNPFNLFNDFFEDSKNLKSSLDKLKLPENVAKEWFKELAESDLCVCGREIDEEARVNIIERSEGYLGEDEVGVLNKIKEDIEESNKDEDLLLKGIKKINTFDKKIRGLNQKKKKLQTESEVDNETLKKLGENIRKLKDELSESESERDRYNNDPNHDLQTTKNISLLKEELKIVVDKIAELSGTIELKRKKDKLIEVINITKKKAKKKINNFVIIKSNEYLREILPPENKIQISEINNVIKLNNKSGASVGETMSVAYSFMASLFKEAEGDLPFIVDSPANPIDLNVRREIAGIIPNLTKQFIAFTISSERKGFIDILNKSNQKNEIQYLTLFRKSDKSLDIMKYKPIESSDGYLINNKDFFFNFQMDEEDENV